MSSILISCDSIVECFYFNDSKVTFELYSKKSEILSSEILAVRLDARTLQLIKHNHYQCADSYWNVESVDITHCNIELRLPSPVDDIDYYNRVRNKLIKRVETILKKHYTAKNLTDSQGA